MARSKQLSDVYQIKVTLEESKPPIWRRFQVRGDTTLYKLHLILQVVMGWENYHLYQFIIDGTSFGEPDSDYDFEMKSARRVKLSNLYEAFVNFFIVPSVWMILSKGKALSQAQIATHSASRPACASHLSAVRHR